MSRLPDMTALAPQLPDTPARFMVGGRDTRATPSERSVSLTLLRARIRGLPGLDLPDPPPAGRARARAAAGGPLRLRIDVRGTGLTGYELGRRMRKFSGVPLECCEADVVVAVFEHGDDISTRGSRLVFALAHALTA